VVKGRIQIKNRSIRDPSEFLYHFKGFDLSGENMNSKKDFTLTLVSVQIRGQNPANIIGQKSFKVYAFYNFKQLKFYVARELKIEPRDGGSDCVTLTNASRPPREWDDDANVVESIQGLPQPAVYATIRLEPPTESDVSIDLDSKTNTPAPSQRRLDRNITDPRDKTQIFRTEQMLSEIAIPSSEAKKSLNISPKSSPVSNFVSLAKINIDVEALPQPGFAAQPELAHEDSVEPFVADPEDDSVFDPDRSCAHTAPRPTSPHPDAVMDFSDDDLDLPVLDQHSQQSHTSTPLLTAELYRDAPQANDEFDFLEGVLAEGESPAFTDAVQELTPRKESKAAADPSADNNWSSDSVQLFGSEGELGGELAGNLSDVTDGNSALIVSAVPAPAPADLRPLSSEPLSVNDSLGSLEKASDTLTRHTLSHSLGELPGGEASETEPESRLQSERREGQPRTSKVPNPPMVSIRGRGGGPEEEAPLLESQELSLSGKFGLSGNMSFTGEDSGGEVSDPRRSPSLRRGRKTESSKFNRNSARTGGPRRSSPSQFRQVSLGARGASFGVGERLSNVPSPSKPSSVRKQPLRGGIASASLASTPSTRRSVRWRGDNNSGRRRSLMQKVQSEPRPNYSQRESLVRKRGGLANTTLSASSSFRAAPDFDQDSDSFVQDPEHTESAYDADLKRSESDAKYATRALARRAREISVVEVASTEAKSSEIVVTSASEALPLEVETAKELLYRIFTFYAVGKKGMQYDYMEKAGFSLLAKDCSSRSGPLLPRATVDIIWSSRDKARKMTYPDFLGVLDAVACLRYGSLEGKTFPTLSNELAQRGRQAFGNPLFMQLLQDIVLPQAFKWQPDPAYVTLMNTPEILDAFVQARGPLLALFDLYADPARRARTLDEPRLKLASFQEFAYDFQLMLLGLSINNLCMCFVASKTKPADWLTADPLSSTRLSAEDFLEAVRRCAFMCLSKPRFRTLDAVCMCKGLFMHIRIQIQRLLRTPKFATFNTLGKFCENTFRNMFYADGCPNYLQPENGMYVRIQCLIRKALRVHACPLF
jgi:hypothetical protein